MESTIQMEGLVAGSIRLVHMPSYYKNSVFESLNAIIIEFTTFWDVSFLITGHDTYHYTIIA